jgi:hypothetical protein
MVMVAHLSNSAYRNPESEADQGYACRRLNPLTESSSDCRSGNPKYHCNNESRDGVAGASL